MHATPAEPSGPAGPIGYTLWAGTVGFTSPLAERFAAAAATGCRQATLSPPDVLRAAGSGTTAGDIGRQARDLGLDLVMDPVMNWYPDREPSPSRFAGVSTDDAPASTSNSGSPLKKCQVSKTSPPLGRPARRTRSQAIRR